MTFTRRFATPALLASAGALLAACAPLPSAAPAPALTASAALMPRSGSTVSGSVRFEQMGSHVMAHVSVRGLNPGQEHGFHIHEKGDCSAADATSAGGHFNPTAQPHGPQHADHHSGDMPSLRADGNGEARATFHLKNATLLDGPTNIVGRGIIVHRDADDYRTQPTGNSGPRWACGVITR